ncbi:hypothetical protein [Streptomyces violaceusniger]|uniref:hypothetical protein n=1 Tax=Streptomyces violaceusniger TaxID=68280 RepID=UPI0001E4C945|nr:hypothetical protein [Streptomyces violaceusniger]
MARRLSGGHGLALAVLWAALLSAPYGLAHAGSALLDPRVLWVAAVVAVASSVLPYSLNLEALRSPCTPGFSCGPLPRPDLTPIPISWP